MRYAILTFLWAVALVAYVQRSAISVPLQEIGRDLAVQDSWFGDATRALGFLQSAWHFGYALFQIPAGRLADRIGGRRALVLYCILWSLATAVTGFARSYWEIVAAWTLMGALQAGVFPCAVRSIGQVFGEKERARASGWLGAGMLAGGAIAPVLTAWLLERFAPWAAAENIGRWRICLVLYCLPGLVWAAAYWLGTRKAGLDAVEPSRMDGGARPNAVSPGSRRGLLLKRNDASDETPGAEAPAAIATRSNDVSGGKPGAEAMGRGWTDRSLLLLCGQQFLRAAAMIFFVTWFPTFLRETRGVSLLESGKLTSYAGVAAMLGVVCGGYASDWILARTGSKRLARQVLASIAMATCAVLILLSSLVADVNAAIALIALGAFVACFGGVAGYTVAIDYGGERVGVVFGAMNMAGGIGAMLFPVTVGWLVSATGTWNAALFTFSALMVIDAVLWALLNPQGQFLEADSKAAAVVTVMLTLAGTAMAAEPAAAPVPVTAEERQALRTEIDEVAARLAPLRMREGISSDLWADADLFVKAARWAVDLVPALDGKGREQVQAALRRARERAAALEAGRHPWAKRQGKSIRGFVSEVDGSTQLYGLIVPAGHDPTKPIRLDVVLHGSMGAAGNAELGFSSQFDGGDGAGDADTHDFIELHPLGRIGENAYRFEGETDVDEAIASVCRQFAIDRRRIVLRGASLGGVGAWSLGLKRPDRYAALGPVCGPVDTHLFAAAPWKHFVRLGPLRPWQERTLHMVDAIDYAANAGMVPVVAVMGDQDPYFPSHLQMERAFAAEGIPFVGLIDRGAGHSVTAPVITEQMRLIGERVVPGLPVRPPKVRFVTWTLKFSRCHWVELLGLDVHYRRAEIEATLALDGSVNVTKLVNITRFALHPPALVPVADAAAPPTVSIEGTTIPLPAVSEAAAGSRSLVFERRDGRWVCAGEAAAMNLSGKRPGMQGPIDDAFARPFLCVRGTGTPWNAAVGRWADASLRRFADEWRRHYRGELPVKDDTAVTPADLARCNLVLFGDPGSNRWIRDTLPHLPITWQADRLRVGGVDYTAAEHAVQLIHPNPLPGADGRYVVLNSGHTYHDEELRFSYMVFPRLGDWAVTKVGEQPADTPPAKVAEKVVMSGYFDESWRLP